jgi:hypothetical protein
MTQVEELQTRIRNLPTADFKDGKFDRLIEKALSEFAQGKAREL